MYIRASRRMQYAIAHRIQGHEHACRYIHGHNFVFTIGVEYSSTGFRLDSLGRVIDFAVIKRVIGGWIETAWDHGVVLCEGDDEAIAAMRMIKGQKLFLLECQPTAENLGRFLLAVSNKLLNELGVTVRHIRVDETENSYAEVYADD